MANQYAPGDAITCNMYGVRVPAVFVELHDEVPTFCWIALNADDGDERLVKVSDIRPAK